MLDVLLWVHYWDVALVPETLAGLPGGVLLGARDRGGGRLSLALGRLRIDLPVANGALMFPEERVLRAIKGLAGVDVIGRDACSRCGDRVRVAPRCGVVPEVGGKPGDVFLLLQLLVVATVRPAVVGTNRGSRHGEAVECLSCWYSLELGEDGMHLCVGVYVSVYVDGSRAIRDETEGKRK